MRPYLPFHSQSLRKQRNPVMCGQYFHTNILACPWTANANNQTYYDDVHRLCTLGNIQFYSECPSTPPLYKSFDTTVRTCLQYCAVGSYALDTTRACVDICPSYYFINATLSFTERRCVSKCPNETYLDTSNNHCVKSKNCPASEYGDPVTGRCAAQCSSVNGQQLFIDDNPNRKICVYVCPTGYYRQN